MAKDDIRFANKEENQKSKITNEQIHRMDELDNAAHEYLKIMTENPNLEWDQKNICELGNIAADLMYHKGFKVHYPTVKTGSDGTKTMVDYYEPEKKLLNGKIINDAYWNEERLGKINPETAYEEFIPEDLNKYNTKITNLHGGNLTIWAHNEDEAMDIAGYLTEDEIETFINCSHVGLKVEMIKPNKQNKRMVTLILKDQDGLKETFHTISVVTSLPKDEIIPAIKAAAQDYLNTPEGRKTWEDNCENFNYGDFDLCVPNEICILHGIYLLDSAAEIIYEDFNTTLAEPEYDEDDEDEE